MRSALTPHLSRTLPRTTWHQLADRYAIGVLGIICRAGATLNGESRVRAHVHTEGVVAINFQTAQDLGIRGDGIVATSSPMFALGRSKCRSAWTGGLTPANAAQLPVGALVVASLVVALTDESHRSMHSGELSIV